MAGNPNLSFLKPPYGLGQPLHCANEVLSSRKCAITWFTWVGQRHMQKPHVARRVSGLRILVGLEKVCGNKKGRCELMWIHRDN